VNDCRVLDASVVLAYLNEESGAQVIESALDAGPCLITAVNYCEVVGKLIDRGMPLREAASVLDAIGLHLIPFDRALVIHAASLRSRTKKIGASLGDRACLALAEIRLQAGDSPILYTAERSWNKIKWHFQLQLIR
jgi:PIN domain nuclease of toxin-antitoxin system